MKIIQTFLSFAAAFTLGFALTACEEEKNEKAAATNESAFKYGTVEIPVSDGTLCIAPFFVAKEKGFFAKEGVDVKFVSANAETRKIGLNNGTYPITNSDFAFFQSVENGVNALTSDAEFVLVHDVARPFISKEIIRDVCETLVTKGSCLVAKPAVDTIKIAKDGCVQQTIDRNTVWMAQTPQAASIALLKKLYGRIAAEPLDFTPTDEASILEYFGESVYIVKGNAANDKLTTPEDFEIFASRAR